MIQLMQILVVDKGETEPIMPSATFGQIRRYLS
jgi:hypothetical protein